MVRVARDLRVESRSRQQDESGETEKQVEAMPVKRDMTLPPRETELVSPTALARADRRAATA